MLISFIKTEMAGRHFFIVLMIIIPNKRENVEKNRSHSVASHPSTTCTEQSEVFYFPNDSQLHTSVFHAGKAR